MSYDRVQMNIDAWVERQKLARSLAIRALHRLTDPTAAGLLQLHAPVEHEWGEDTCAGCPSDDNGDESWPCPVVLQIAEIHGIHYPTHGWADDPDFDRYAAIPGYPTNIEETSVRACRVCSCTDDRACPGGCFWVGPALCSRCQS